MNTSLERKRYDAYIFADHWLDLQEDRYIEYLEQLTVEIERMPECSIELMAKPEVTYHMVNDPQSHREVTKILEAEIWANHPEYGGWLLESSKDIVALSRKYANATNSIRQWLTLRVPMIGKWNGMPLMYILTVDLE